MNTEEGFAIINSSLYFVLSGARDARFFPGPKVKVMRPEKLDGIAVVDAQGIRSVIVVDSVSVVQKTAVRFLLLANVVLRGSNCTR